MGRVRAGKKKWIRAMNNGHRYDIHQRAGDADTGDPVHRYIRIRVQDADTDTGVAFLIRTHYTPAWTRRCWRSRAATLSPPVRLSDARGN